MKTIVIPGIVLGVLAAAWLYVMGLTGWYKHPQLAMLFVPVVVVIHIGVLIWALRRNAHHGASYGSQVGQGTALSAVAALLIILASLSFTTLAFPRYFEELREIQVQLMHDAGKPAAEIEQAIRDAEKMNKPWIAAVVGAFMTVLTGLVASLVIAIFTKRKATA